jgi:SNF2 family DNA or RNA helicase
MNEYQMITKPYAHQQRVFELSKNRAFYALFWEMGLGKTKTILDTIGHMYTAGQIEGALIVAPKGVYMNWYYDEIEMHLGLEDYFWGLYSSAPRKEQRLEMEEMLKKRNICTICVMNVEAFSGKKGTAYAEKFLKAHHSMIVVDESTAIKSWKAARTKALVKLGRVAVAKRILSGTPITQSPLDMFSQCEFLKNRALGFPTWTAFRSYFSVTQQMRMGTRSFEKIIGFRNLNDLEDAIRPFSSRIKKTDCLDLPEKIYSKRYIEMTKEQQDAYQQMRDIAVLQLESGMVTTTSALTTIVKLHQIVCGHCKDDDGNVNDLPNNRVQAVIDIAEENPDKKIIIFCNYQRDVELLDKELQKVYGSGSTATYYGKTPQEERQINLKRFRMLENNCRFFISTSAGSKGITLIESTLTVYYSNSYNLETRLQSEDRNHRIGQNKTVNYIDLICPGTIDDKIVSALKQKKNLADSVMDTLRDACYN